MDCHPRRGLAASKDSQALENQVSYRVRSRMACGWAGLALLAIAGSGRWFWEEATMRPNQISFSDNRSMAARTRRITIAMNPLTHSHYIHVL